MSPGGVFCGDGLEEFLRRLLAQLLGGLQHALWGQQVGWDGGESWGLWWGRVCMHDRWTSNTAAIADRAGEYGHRGAVSHKPHTLHLNGFV